MEYLVVGILFAITGLISIVMGDTVWRGAIIYGWTGWPILALSLVVCLMALRAMRRAKGKPKPPPPTDEEIAKIKAELDAGYLRDYGELPEKPKHPEKKA